jgi:MFS family permease
MQTEVYRSSWEAKLDSLAEIIDVAQGGETFGRMRMSGGGNAASGALCNKQKLRLNLMLTVAVTLLNLVCFPLGVIVDKTGPRWVGLGGSLLTIVGSVLFAFSDSRNFDAYIPAYAAIGIGGVGIFMSLLHLLNVFPEHRGLLTTLYTATEDASTGVFFFFRRIHAAGISLRTLFLAYTSVPILHLLVVAFQPSKVVLNEKTEKCAEFYPVSLQPLRKQALSTQYISVVLWNAAMGVTTYFYLSSLHDQLIWLFGSAEMANKGTEIFSFLFMIFPFLAVPFTGWIIDAFGTWPSLLCVAAQCLTYGLLACVRVWWLQYITWAMFVVTRASFIGVSAHWVNQMFGENFSTLVGMMWTVGGLCNFSNYLWNYIVITVFKSNFLIMNLIMTAISVSSTLAAAYIVKKSLGNRGDDLPLAEALPSSFSDESLDTMTRSDSFSSQGNDSD